MDDHTLGFGLAFTDLYEREGLVRLDRRFLEHLAHANQELANRLLAARAQPKQLDAQEESELLIELAPHLEGFLGELFGVSAEVESLAARHGHLAPLYTCRRLFVQRQAAKKIKPEEATEFDGDALARQLEALLGEGFTELGFARQVMAWREDETAHTEELEIARRYAAWAVHTPEGQARHGNGVLFKAPAKIDPYHLIPVETIEHDGVTMLRVPKERQRRRDGFGLTDSGTDLTGALSEANYCILCHNQGKDSCSKGLFDSKTGAFKRSPFNVPLTGCPLEERVSEMHTLKGRGVPVGALAMITVDNPMCAATGHRICNDCMKSCIYQKQEPVDIPQVETRILKDVLELPWGFEIYSLLTRWNPLDLHRPLPKPISGYKVLVVGLGPAGFTLAHHLMNEGHTVVAIDGLKIEPLPESLSGVTAATGERVPFQPVKETQTLYEALDERVMAGFGGVAEYGITARWDKNFLKIIRLLLERRQHFAMIGGVRFGGTLSLEDAFDYGFDHIALAAGAGRPNVIPMENGLARGVRQASDFLMALQLTGAAKADSLANLEVRMPIVVIGGGLTAIDTATESLAYYPSQVEKFLVRYETLVAERGEAAVRAAWNEEERATADEFLEHARLLRAERRAAAAQDRSPRIQELLQSWGGATIVYRRRLIDAPSYTLNHEEVTKALEEGIHFVEETTPVKVETDHFGHAAGLRVKHHSPSGEEEERVLPAKTVLVAAGTQPNTALARERPGWVGFEGRHFQPLDRQGQPASAQRLPKPDQVNILMSIEDDGRAVSYFGDLHPDYAGNVVKAMASAKQGYPVISEVLNQRPPSSVPPEEVITRANRELRATVYRVSRLAPTIIEVVVKAPQAAANFQPGQFYRLQNFEAQAPYAHGTRLAMEGLAMTGAWVDREAGLLSTIVLEVGGSSDLCTLLTPGEPVTLMGPTGSPTEIPVEETVMLVGGGLGNAVLFSIGQACRANGCQVLYFAGYRHPQDRYKADQIERAADQVVWCCDQPPGLEPRRPQDKAFLGNIVEAIRAYGAGELGETEIDLKAIDRILVIGSDRMMAAVTQARHTVLASYLNPSHVAIGSINSPMQCMMKEICAQCLQVHHDPTTGEEKIVFSCFNQDQPLDHVDFHNLNDRLRQNSVQEKLTAHWIDHCLKHLAVRKLAS